MFLFLLCVLVSSVSLSGQDDSQDRSPRPAEKQVVLETDAGSLVLELFPEAAPAHVAAFQKRVREGFFAGTTFHRAVPMGIIQGGDPVTRDPTRFDEYGTGGLFELESEINDLSHVRGTVSAVLVPGEPDSAGSQFFVCVSDQVQLDGQFTIFGRVVEGMDVAERISTMPVDDSQKLTERVEIVRTFERERPPPERPPFADATVAELEKYRARIQTNLGRITIRFFPEAAPEHVRQFLRFSELGLYDGTEFHRVVPGFVIQGGSLASRSEPVPERHAKWVRPLEAEFNQYEHLPGRVSMARGEDPNSGVDSFFIVLAPQPSLDGEYTIFGEVVQGIDTVDGISQVPTQGEKPISPVRIERITLDQD